MARRAAERGDDRGWLLAAHPHRLLTQGGLRVYAEDRVHRERLYAHAARWSRLIKGFIYTARSTSYQQESWDIRWLSCTSTPKKQIDRSHQARGRAGPRMSTQVGAHSDLGLHWLLAHVRRSSWQEGLLLYESNGTLRHSPAAKLVKAKSFSLPSTQQ